MAERWGRTALLASVLLCCTPAPAAADWYFTPFAGWIVQGNTTLIDWEYGNRDRTATTVGVSAALLVGIFGVEVDYAVIPAFFQNPACDGPVDSTDCSTMLAVITDDRVQTLTGNVIIAAPLALTRESLRPYLAAGLGWMDVRANSLANYIPIDTNLVAFNVGGGAIGMLGNRTGVRFDLRRFTNIDRDTPSGNSLGGSARLGFWRATVGLTFRY